MKTKLYLPAASRNFGNFGI